MVSYKWIALSNTTVGSLMVAIDMSIVIIALPTILVQLPGTGIGEGIWVILGYQLLLATLILNFGRLGDMFGRVRMYNFGFALFTIGSLHCSLSQTGIELILLRLLQGVGGALIWSNSSAILTDAFPLHERGRALGMNQVALVSGMTMGLVLGGVLTATLGWRSIFWVNVPIGIFGTVWAHYQLKEIGQMKKGERLDLPGNATFAGGLTLLLLGITYGSLKGFDRLTDIFFIVGIMLLIAFALIEEKVKFPMIDLNLFKIRIFTAGNLAVLCFALARGAFNFVMVFYLQGALGFDPLTAGLMLVPTSATVVIFGPLSGWLSDRYGPRWFAAGGLALNCVAFLTFAQLPGNISYLFLFIPMLVFGAGIGMFSSPNRSVTLSSVPAFRRGIAAGTNSMFPNVGMLVSLGTSIAILAFSVPKNILLNVFGGIASTAAGSPLDLNAFTTGMHNVWYLSAFLSFLGIIPVVIGYKRANELREETVDSAEQEI